MVGRSRSISIQQRLLILTALVGVGMVTIGGVALYSLYDKLLEERREQTRRMVEVGHSLLVDFHRLAEQGVLSQEEARQEAGDRLAALRYDGDQYFWINDMDGVMQIHPSVAPGTQVLTIRDAHDEAVFADIIDLVEREGGGTYDYWWPPGETAQLKTSYVRGFEPWGWVVGSGVYVTDVVETFWQGAAVLAGIALALVVGVSVVAISISRGIAGSIAAMTAAMRRLAEGDLKVDIPARTRTDEVGQMAAALDVFKESLIEREHLNQAAQAEQAARDARAAQVQSLTEDFDRRIGTAVGAVVDAAGGLQSTADDLAQASEDGAGQARAAADASQQSTSSVQTVATATEELSRSITEIARQVGDQAEMAGQATAVASDSTTRVRGLEGKAQSIGSVLDLISTIAAQTNLLALNATIEAARAGEAGRGFAVVANEVKTLASETAKATEEIAGLIQDMQSETGGVVQAMDQIAEKIAAIDSIAREVATSVEQQSAATQEISRSVRDAASGAERVAQGIAATSEATDHAGTAAQQVLDAAAGLKSSADEVRADVTRFLADVRTA